MFDMFDMFDMFAQDCHSNNGHEQAIAALSA
jgi:hypothetical protein